MTISALSMSEDSSSGSYTVVSNGRVIDFELNIQQSQSIEMNVQQSSNITLVVDQSSSETV